MVQRVSAASVTVENQIIGATGPGLLVLICAMQGDTDATATRLADKIARLRIFRDDKGRMNLSVQDTGGSALVISQFTLAANLRGNRPGFASAAPPDEGRHLYALFTETLRTCGIRTATGQFGADMAVALVNDGPVTIWLDTDHLWSNSPA